VKLSNPPVTQTAIGFTFEPAAQKRPWNIKSALEFLVRYESLLPRREAIFERRVEVQEESPEHPLRIVNQETQLDFARAYNDERTHWMQIADNGLFCNRTRGEETYLGYESLRDEALSKLYEYVEFFRPTSLRSAELFYVDQIEIPIPAERKIDLEKYFKLRVEIPSEYGPTWYFSTRLFLSPPIEGDILEVKFESAPPIPNASGYRFRIDWRLVCAGIAVFDREVVTKRLDDAHDCLSKYFKQSVTEQTWALFQPSEEG
jgi:uncharacterized protein (TIGR04255 family)